MGVTRKERLLKAMLEDNSTACRGGVTREERYLAGVGKKMCDVAAEESPKPYQMLVTDENGESKWEERTHYPYADWVSVHYNGKPQNGLIINTAKGNGFCKEKLMLASNGGNVDFALNNKLKVVFDDAEYEVICGENCSFGNAYLAGGTDEDNGLPFFVVQASSNPSDSFQDLYARTSGSHSINILKIGTAYKPLTKEYMPERVQRLIKEGDTRGAGAIAFQQGLALGTNSIGVNAGRAEGIKATALNTAYANAYNSFAIGMMTNADSDNQFTSGKHNVVDAEGKYAHIVGNGTNTGNLSNAYTLDWSGNGWFAGTVEGTGVIVKSSTEGSSKRFKITVDDSGAITATEVTE